MESKRIERSVLCNAEWVQADAEGGCDVIRKLEQGHCVQYMRDGGWRVGHVHAVVTVCGVGVLLVRERNTDELLVMEADDAQTHPQSPIPEPVSDVVQDGELWHAADDCPDTSRNVMGDFGGRLFKVWCSPVTRTWYLGPGDTPTPTRWRELKKGE